MKRSYVKVYYENGDSINTWINLNAAEAKQYYLGNVFNIGSVTDNLQRCINVEVLQEEAFTV